MFSSFPRYLSLFYATLEVIVFIELEDVLDNHKKTLKGQKQ